MAALNEQEEFEFRHRMEQEASNQSPRTWGNVAAGAATSFLPSVGKMVGDIASTVLHPIDTATSLGKTIVGAGEAGAEKLAGLVDPELVAFNRQLNAPSERQQMAGQMADYYKQKYGSMEGFKEALATDPASVLADAATVLSGGGGAATQLRGAASKLRKTAYRLGMTETASTLGKAASALKATSGKLSQAASAVDPLALTVKAAGKGVQLAGKGIQAGLGMTTGAGAEAIKQAYQAGKEGGPTATAFQENLRGNAPMTDVLDTAKADLAAMNAAKTAEYRKNMSAVKEVSTPLPFDNIGNAVKDAYDTVTYKGQIKNAQGADVVKKISDAIGDWRELDPAQYHTPEGFDALKQVVGGIVESIPFEQKTARMVGGKVYNAIKDEIVNKAPTYAKTMQDYSAASDQIKEIERALSLGNKAAADTAMRKLQSLMRNNASTNYGNRLKLAEELEQQGGRRIMPSLAGQALSSPTPRGLQGLGATGVAGAGVMTANPLAVPLLATSSPRLVGEAAYYTGKGAKVAGKGKNTLANLIRDPRLAANLAYQAQQPKR